MIPYISLIASKEVRRNYETTRGTSSKLSHAIKYMFAEEEPPEQVRKTLRTINDITYESLKLIPLIEQWHQNVCERMALQ